MTGSIVFDLARGLGWHAVRLATFRGTLKAMPSSLGLSLLLMTLSIIFGLTEQLARGKELVEAILLTGLWVAFVFMCSHTNGKTDWRLTSALFLASLPIQIALALVGLLQAETLEWVVIFWGVAVLFLIIEKAWRES